MKQGLSHKLVHKVAGMPKLQHGAVRVAVWLTAVAERTGGFPVEIFYSHVISGYSHDGVEIPGIAIRPPTITKSFQSLKEAGLLTIEDSEFEHNGHFKKRCTLNLD